MCLSSARETKDCTANYYGNEDYGREIMSKTKLESITWRKHLPMMDSLLKFGSCHPGTLAGRFRRSFVWFQLESREMRIMQKISYVHACIRIQKAGRIDGGSGSAESVQMTSPPLWCQMTQRLFINMKFPAGSKKSKINFSVFFEVTTRARWQKCWCRHQRWIRWFWSCKSICTEVFRRLSRL